MSSLMCFNKKMFGKTAIAAFMIIVGMLIVNHHLDIGNNDTNILLGGMMLFLGGWVWLAYIFSYDDKARFKGFSMKLFKQKGFSALLVPLAVMAMIMILRSNRSQYLWGIGLFVIAWLMFAYVMADKRLKDKKGNWNQKALYLFGGTIMLILSMAILFKYRKWDLRSNKLTGPGYVYNPGLAMFGIGWVMVCAGLSYRRTL